MWPIPLPSLSTKFFLIVIALLSFALSLSMLHGRWLKLEVAELEAEIQTTTNAAKQYADQSKITAKETSNAFTILVNQIKDKNLALQNAKARFGTYSSLCTGTVRLPTKYDSSETRIPERTVRDEEHERVVVDRTFIDGAASCAAFVKLTKQWVVENKLPISK